MQLAPINPCSLSDTCMMLRSSIIGRVASQWRGGFSRGSNGLRFCPVVPSVASVYPIAKLNASPPCFGGAVGIRVFSVKTADVKSANVSGTVSKEVPEAPYKNTSQEVPETNSSIVAYHLFTSAALVFAIVVVGGLTRLTESGLSITEWNPGFKGMQLPMNEEQWQAEFDKYMQTPEFKVLNFNMSREEFKTIFLWEWSHRVLGRVIGVAFVLPALYFSLRRGYTTRSVRWKLLAIGAGIGFQGLLGWVMVASGLKNPYEGDKSDQPTPEWTPRVSHFRLAAHLGAAFAVYMGMLYTGIQIMRDSGAIKKGSSATDSLVKMLDSPRVRRFRGAALGLTTLVFFTAMYGALVAGLDAGLVYNEFPTMGDGRVLPPMDELLDKRFRLRGAADSDDSALVAGNATLNPVTVQAIHRVLGVSSLAALIVYARYARKIREYIPRAARAFAIGASHMGIVQVALGISTLLYMVPIPLASMHQCGSLVTLSLLTGVLAMTKRPSQALRAFARTAEKSKSHA